MDEEDFDFDLPKSKVKKGRRARSEKEKQKLKSRSPDAENDLPEEPKQPAQTNRPSRRQTGWDMSSAAPDDIFDSRLVQQDSLSESESEIQVIPDLDDLQEDDLHQEMAAPPTLTTNNMATFRELDVDLMNQSAFRTLDGIIDMKVLIKNLPSEKEVREEQDVEWEWEKLFAQVSSVIKSNQSDEKVTPNPSQERVV